MRSLFSLRRTFSGDSFFSENIACLKKSLKVRNCLVSILEDAEKGGAALHRVSLLKQANRKIARHTRTSLVFITYPSNISNPNNILARHLSILYADKIFHKLFSKPLFPFSEIVSSWLRILFLRHAYICTRIAYLPFILQLVLCLQI